MNDDTHLETLRNVTADLRDARSRRYAAISDALAAGHSQTDVATAAGISPSALSRLIRQDTGRSRDRRLLPGLRDGEVNGRRVRWFVAALPLED